MEMQKVILTKDGEAKLTAELRQLIDVTRPEVIEQLSFARAQGDLSENAEYDAARARQAEVEGRIKQIEDILAVATVIDDTPTSAKTVALGTKVTILDFSDNVNYEYKIVGTVEADPINNRISNASPLGEAIIGKHVGDKAMVKVAKPYQVQIVRIDLA
jgi:transcription elongation factor GreA